MKFLSLHDLCLALQNLLNYKCQKSGDCKSDRKNNGRVEGKFLKASAGVETGTEIVTQSTSEAGSGTLKQNADAEKHRQNDLYIGQKMRKCLH